MRGEVDPQQSSFAHFSAEGWVPENHPLRTIKRRADAALKARSSQLDGLHFNTGQPSIGLAPHSGHPALSNLGCFKRLGADAAELAVPPLAIVGRLDVVEDVGTGQATRAVDAFLDPLLFLAR